MRTLIAEFGIPCPAFGLHRALMDDGQTHQITANLGVVSLTWLPFSITALLLASSLDLAEARTAVDQEADDAG